MNIFADTFYFLALMNPRDAAHQRAIEWAEASSDRLVTTTAIMLEMGDAMCSPRDRPRCLTLLARLRTNPVITIVTVDDELFERGIDLFRRRPDKDWPLTDCISFTVMADMDITDALTADDHFRQAGFDPLFSEP